MPFLSRRLSFVFFSDLSGTGWTVQCPVGAGEEPAAAPFASLSVTGPNDLWAQCRIKRQDGVLHPAADKMVRTQLDTGAVLCSVRSKTFSVPGIVVAAFRTDQGADHFFLLTREPIRFTQRIFWQWRNVQTHGIHFTVLLSWDELFTHRYVKIRENSAITNCW